MPLKTTTIDNVYTSSPRWKPKPCWTGWHVAALSTALFGATPWRVGGAGPLAGRANLLMSGQPVRVARQDHMKLDSYTCHGHKVLRRDRRSFAETGTLSLLTSQRHHCFHTASCIPQR